MASVPVLSVILPTFNEADNIVEMISALQTTLNSLGIKYEIRVIDDNSEDGTGEKVSQLFGDTVHLTVRKNERGLASALLLGIEQAKGEFLLLMDSDFNHKPSDVPRLLEHINTADLIVGSRYIKGGGMPHAPVRHKLSLMFNLFVRGVLRLSVKDSLSGFVCIRRCLLLQLPLANIFTGYGDFCIRLMYIARRSGLRIKEVPVKYGTRLGGISKTRFFYHAIQYSKVVLALRRTEIKPLPKGTLAAAAATAIEARGGAE
jgi:dolichol-phosphate mannosyltransferase